MLSFLGILFVGYIYAVNKLRRSSKLHLLLGNRSKLEKRVKRVKQVFMKTIVIDDDVFAALDRLTSPLFSHGDVIRKLMMTHEDVQRDVPADTSDPVPKKRSLVEYVGSAEYRMLTSGINRYLAVLGWLYRNYSEDFEKVEKYKRGSRVYFGRSQKEVEEGGNGAISAKKIPNSPVWALATLDNRSKRTILSDLLPLFGFSSNEISAVASTISDSGRHRNSSF